MSWYTNHHIDLILQREHLPLVRPPENFPHYPAPRNDCHGYSCNKDTAKSAPRQYKETPRLQEHCHTKMIRRSRRILACCIGLRCPTCHLAVRSDDKVPQPRSTTLISDLSYHLVLSTTTTISDCTFYSHRLPRQQLDLTNIDGRNLHQSS